MPATIRDVARKLKISITTVSRALDGYDDVAPRTRELVIQTARKLGYAPNRAARQLRRQKAETIGFILPSISRSFNEPFFTQFLTGLGEELSARNFDLLIANASSDEAERDLYHRWVNSRKVDGFILSRLRKHDWRVAFLSMHRAPFAGLGKSHEGLPYPCVRIEAAEAYLDLVRHLRAREFSRMAFIGGPGDLVHQIERLRWFRLALRKCDLGLQSEHLISTDMTSGGGYRAARTLLALPSAPDAILCVNDEAAFGALHAAHERRLKIGQQIAIAGFDGVPESRHTQPALTTVELPVDRVARELVTMLLETLGDPSLPPREVVLRPEPVFRASTGGALSGPRGHGSRDPVDEG